MIEGFLVTLKHLFKKKFTIQYPEEKKPLPKGYRGVHKLNKDEQGRVKCVACYLCPTVCPSKAITIESAPSPWQDREKVPTKFEIDLLKCIFCGCCEEVCPVDAIVLTDKIPPVGTKREDFIYYLEINRKNVEIDRN